VNCSYKIVITDWNYLCHFYIIHVTVTSLVWYDIHSYMNIELPEAMGITSKSFVV